MDKKEQIESNIKIILSRIEGACQRRGRDPKDVKLLLATKTVSAENIKLAFEAGQMLIGENKVQEIAQKYVELKDVEHQTHFIGHLQTNKINELLRYNVSCIQSVDRFRLAKKINDRLERDNRHMDILIQVNTTGEDTKFGVAPEGLIDLVKKVSLLDRLHIKGLMTIGLFSSDAKRVRECYRMLKDLQKDVLSSDVPGVEMLELSMGMSDHLEIAVEEGATIVRVGTAIFGERIYPDSYYWNEGK